MGSSCFVRGNKENLKIIQAFLNEHKLKAEITVDGVLCKNNCNHGPNVCIDGEWFTEVNSKSKMRALLEEKLLER
jgi:NADH:ubiquinone oxidoreductase subunit E